ncbi:MAG: MarR family transcriptional regulator [Vallitaleaceae bacterium]|nr:MarR family transcriptional regulator [Vallitaleaceae bacterium]
MNQKELQAIFRLMDSIYMKIEKRSKERLASDVFNNLTIAEAKTIFAIGNKELRSMKQISEQLCIAQNTATVAVERLIAKDIAIKEPSSEDRRQSFVRLTKKGIHTMDQIDEVTIEQIELFLSPLSEVEIVLFKNILEKVDGSI